MKREVDKERNIEMENAITEYTERKRRGKNVNGERKEELKEKAVERYI
jgi:hypothetical protein